MNFSFNVNGANPNGFILRIERLIGANRRELTFLYLEEPLSGQNFGKSQITHTLEGNFLQDIFENGVTYRWRIDFVSGDKRHFGSESDWEEFTVTWGS